MTKEELEKEAEEKYGEVDREFIACQDEGEVFNIGYVLGAEPREKRITKLEAQIEKMKKIIINLLWFEENLDPYMYECNDAQKGELLKPFDNARDILKDCVCKKCKGSGIVREGYQGWCKNSCPSCKGIGYIIKEIKEK